MRELNIILLPTSALEQIYGKMAIPSTHETSTLLVQAACPANGGGPLGPFHL